MLAQASSFNFIRCGLGCTCLQKQINCAQTISMRARLRTVDLFLVSERLPVRMINTYHIQDIQLYKTMLALRSLSVLRVTCVPRRHLFSLNDVNKQAKQSINAAKNYAQESAIEITDASVNSALEQSRNLMKLSEEKFRNEGVDITITFGVGPISVALTKRSSEISPANPEHL